MHRFGSSAIGLGTEMEPGHSCRGYSRPPPTPAPTVTPTPDVSVEEPDLFTSGDADLYGISVMVVTEVDKTDWEKADALNNRYKLRKADGSYYTAADGIVYIKTVNNKAAAASDTQAHEGYAGYYLFVYTLLSQEIHHGGTSKSRFSKVLL